MSSRSSDSDVRQCHATDLSYSGDCVSMPVLAVAWSLGTLTTARRREALQLRPKSSLCLARSLSIHAAASKQQPPTTLMEPGELLSVPTRNHRAPSQALAVKRDNTTCGASIERYLFKKRKLLCSRQLVVQSRSRCGFGPLRARVFIQTLDSAQTSTQNVRAALPGPLRLRPKPKRTYFVRRIPAGPKAYGLALAAEVNCGHQ